MNQHQRIVTGPAPHLLRYIETILLFWFQSKYKDPKIQRTIVSSILTDYPRFFQIRDFPHQTSSYSLKSINLKYLETYQHVSKSFKMS